MNKIIYKSIILLACICCLQSCKKEEIMYYEGGSAVHFLSKTQNHSFLLTLDEQYGEMTIPVMLVGNPVDKDINLSYEIINDEQYTTASSEHAVPGGRTVPNPTRFEACVRRERKP